MGKRESARQRRRGIVRAKGGAKFAFSRIRVPSRKDKACEACGYSRKLQVHHKTYERLGKERNSDLVLLCRDCHESLHRFRAAERISLGTATRRFLKLARRAS